MNFFVFFFCFICYFLSNMLVKQGSLRTLITCQKKNEWGERSMFHIHISTIISSLFFFFVFFFRIALTSKRFCERALVFVKRTSKKSWKRLQPDNFSSSKTSWRCLEDIFKTCLRYVLQKPLQDVFQDVFKTYLQDVLRPFEDVLKISCNYVLKTSSRRLQYVFTKTNVCWERKWIACLNSFLVKANPCSSAVSMFNQLEAYRNPGLLQSLMTCW